MIPKKGQVGRESSFEREGFSEEVTVIQNIYLIFILVLENGEILIYGSISTTFQSA